MSKTSSEEVPYYTKTIFYRTFDTEAEYLFWRLNGGDADKFDHDFYACNMQRKPFSEVDDMQKEINAKD